MGESGCHEFRELTRRRILKTGGAGLAGLGLAGLPGLDVPGLGLQGLLTPRLNAADLNSEGLSTVGFGKAKRCLILFMWGGPSQIDTWDPKPEAPTEVRGPFQSIQTNVPGIDICETLPKLAKHAHQLAIIRSMNHDDPAHLSSVHHLMTGHHAPRVKSDADAPSRNDSPHIGSVLAHKTATSDLMPPFVSMPWTVMHPAAPGGTAPGQNGGWLGPAYDPFLIQGDPNAWNFTVSGLSLSPGVTTERLLTRRQLQQNLETLMQGQLNSAYGQLQAKAVDMLTSTAVQRAFDLNQESRETRNSYGRHIHGQCLLLARRLLEAGTQCVCVNWHQDHANFWDTHGDNFNSLKTRLAPPADQGFAALLDDLSQRGLLDDTLITWVGEFGRRPQITTANAGREHWPWCYSAVMAGGGIRGGQVYGRSDRLAAYPAENPVSPADLTSTLYHGLGIPTDFDLRTSEGRPMRLTEGRPMTHLFG